MSRLVLALLASAAALAPAPRRAAKLTARDTATMAPPAIVGGEKMPPPAFKRLGYLPDGAGAITADNTCPMVPGLTSTCLVTCAQSVHRRHTQEA